MSFDQCYIIGLQSNHKFWWKSAAIDQWIWNCVCFILCISPYPLNNYIEVIIYWQVVLLLRSKFEWHGWGIMVWRKYLSVWGVNSKFNWWGIKFVVSTVTVVVVEVSILASLLSVHINIDQGLSSRSIEDVCAFVCNEIYRSLLHCLKI